MRLKEFIANLGHRIGKSREMARVWAGSPGWLDVAIAAVITSLLGLLLVSIASRFVGKVNSAALLAILGVVIVALMILVIKSVTWVRQSKR